mmetsp:Transcript_13879/g.28060  ORF Transcript_13879/g.28060 Transcript_13879/m.28060 type:complete len:428 (+) Transcript_13879:325-1608(+)
MPSPIRRRHHNTVVTSTSRSTTGTTRGDNQQSRTGPTTAKATMQSSSGDTDAIKSITAVTMLAAGFYIVSGVSQPLLMTVASRAGVADPRAQLYMLFYYAGPASVGLTLRRRKRLVSSSAEAEAAAERDRSDTSDERYWPSLPTIARAASIAVLDIVAQSMNYTGNTLCGPTVFAIIYSSVTIWAAVYSRLLLSRDLNCTQWVGVASVFLGLALTALHSVNIGQNVFLGACLVVVGSSLHALTYVVSEKLMTVGDDKISVRANCAVQGAVACFALLMWQLFYTLPRFQELIGGPMDAAGSSWVDAVIVLGSIGLANLIHSTTFFHTLKNFPGGSVSAGVMKGLQAVLVFIFTSIVFCGAAGTGAEMCFDSLKLLSLIVVVGGVTLYGWATEHKRRKPEDEGILSRFSRGNGEYKGIPDVESQVEISC